MTGKYTLSPYVLDVPTLSQAISPTYRCFIQKKQCIHSPCIEASFVQNPAWNISGDPLSEIIARSPLNHRVGWWNDWGAQILNNINDHHINRLVSLFYTSEHQKPKAVNLYFRPSSAGSWWMCIVHCAWYMIDVGWMLDSQTGPTLIMYQLAETWTAARKLLNFWSTPVEKWSQRNDTNYYTTLLSFSILTCAVERSYSGPTYFSKVTG